MSAAIVERGTQPVVERAAPPIAPAARETGRPWYARVPLSTRFAWISNANNGITREIGRVCVREPSLLKVLKIEPALPLATQLSIDFLWKPSGSVSIPGHFTGVDSVYGRQQFFGPYAYFPQAGEYDVIAVHDAGELNPTVQIIAEIIQGIPLGDVAALFNSESSRFVETRTIILAAGVAQQLSPTYHSSFPLFRYLTIQNATANLAILNFGVTISGHARPTIAGNTTLTIPAQLLGRHTLSVTSAAGTTLMTSLSLW